MAERFFLETKSRKTGQLDGSSGNVMASTAEVTSRGRVRS